jgi:hypothetical protein
MEEYDKGLAVCDADPELRMAVLVPVHAGPFPLFD